MRLRRFVAGLLLIVAFVFVGSLYSAEYQYIKGFSKETNEQIKKFLMGSEKITDRKIATFDMDGTVIGQVPHYLADEALYQYALENPDRRPELIKKMSKSLNTSKEYVADRVHYFSGMTPKEIEEIGNKSFTKSYSDKFFPNIKDLISNLKNFGFEIWVVSASPEFLYQGFVAKELGIPTTNIIGIKSVVKNNITTDEIVPPVAQMDGKANAIETIIKAIPMIAAGNSKDDFEMIESSKGLKMIVNPDDSEKVDKLGSLTLKEYAEKHGWIIVHANDIPEEKDPQPACEYFKIRINKTNKCQ